MQARKTEEITQDFDKLQQRIQSSATATDLLKQIDSANELKVHAHSHEQHKEITWKILTDKIEAAKVASVKERLKLSDVMSQDAREAIASKYDDKAIIAFALTVRTLDAWLQATKAAEEYAHDAKRKHGPDKIKQLAPMIAELDEVVNMASHAMERVLPLKPANDQVAIPSKPVKFHDVSLGREAQKAANSLNEPLVIGDERPDGSVAPPIKAKKNPFKSCWAALFCCTSIGNSDKSFKKLEDNGSSSKPTLSSL